MFFIEVFGDHTIVNSIVELHAEWPLEVGLRGRLCSISLCKGKIKQSHSQKRGGDRKRTVGNSVSSLPHFIVFNLSSAIIYASFIHNQIAAPGGTGGPARPA